MDENTIQITVDDDLCTGCGTCFSMCPRAAIDIKIDSKRGTYRPAIDLQKCINCGICIKVCPGKGVDFIQLNQLCFGEIPKSVLIGSYHNCYTGFVNNSNIRQEASSGGVITQILIYALEQGIIDGALVTKMSEENPLIPKPFIARTRKEVIDASKSKYCPVPANIAIKEILNSKKGERFAVVGLPCHIHGIRKAEQVNNQLKDKIVLHLGLFCSNSPNFLATTYILKKHGIEPSSVKNIEYRGRGWPGGMRVDYDDKNQFIPFFKYWNSGFGQYFSSCRCKSCIDQACELADLSFADAWLPEIMSKDTLGTSIIVSRNEFCESLLKMMVHKKIITLTKIDESIVIKSQGQGLISRKTPKNRGGFLKYGKKTPKFNAKFAAPSRSIVPQGISHPFFLFLSQHPSLWKVLDFYIYLRAEAPYFRRIFRRNN